MITTGSRSGKQIPIRILAGRTSAAVVAALVVAASSSVGCSSSTQFDEIQTQLQDLQLEILELRKASPSKVEVEGLEASITEGLQSSTRATDGTTRQLEALTTRVGALEAKLEDTNFKLVQLIQQIESANRELQEIRSSARDVLPPPPPQPEEVDPTADPQSLYESAYADYVRGSYDLAILGFRQYLESYPETDLADNAAYWIGECYFRQGMYQKAVDQFDELMTRWEHSDRNPSALLQKGQAYFQLGQRALGVVQLQNVICEHSGTDEARIARQQLRELGIDADC